MNTKTLLSAAAVIALTASAAAAQMATTPSSSAPGGGAAASPAPTSNTPAAAPGAKVVAKGDIIETAKASGQFTTFLKAVDDTNLTSVLKSNPNLTVFAPTDAAFAALPPGELQRLTTDKAQMQKLLTHHVINARVDSTKFKDARGPVATVAGDQLLLDGTGGALKAGGADITQADVMASNGIIHVVDKVLTPATAQAAAAADTSGAAASTSAAEPPAGEAAPTSKAEKPAPKKK